ncbi:MAG: hypothetical protein L0287_30560 [Anaerolineae bacterium]|nr:hypothetical protein [Anaerolineae bacterium]MCI0610354.1 hypothetical protein [Anaerolineae bacterium]
MDISSRFSLTDFLAYLFPGVFAATGLYFLLLLTPLRTAMTNFPTDLNTGVLFLVFSFIIGVLVAGIAEIFTHRLRHKDDDRLPLIGFEKDVRRAFKDMFGGKEDFEWTRTHFYLCRSMVIQYMPNELQTIQRQSSLRQLRMNMLPSIVILIFAGIGWGWQVYNNGTTLWGIVLIVTSIVLGATMFMTIVNRMQNNDEREIRETLAAFLIGYKTGLFKKENYPPQKNR